MKTRSERVGRVLEQSLMKKTENLSAKAFRVSLGILSGAWKHGTCAVQDGRTDQALWSWSDQYCGFYEGFWWAGGIDAGMEGLAERVI